MQRCATCEHFQRAHWNDNDADKFGGHCAMLTRTLQPHNWHIGYREIYVNSTFGCVMHNAFAGYDDTPLGNARAKARMNKHACEAKK